MRHFLTGRARQSALAVALALVMLAFGGRVLAQGSDFHRSDPNLSLASVFADEEGRIIYISIDYQHVSWDNLFLSMGPGGSTGTGWTCGTSGLDALMPEVQFRGLSLRISGIFDPVASAEVSCFGDPPSTVISFDLTFTPAVLTHTHGTVITNTVGADSSETRLSASTLDVWESSGYGATVSGVFDTVAVDSEVFWAYLRYGQWPAQQ